MLKHLLLLTLLFSGFASTPLLAKQIAFTFDDAPRNANGYFDGPTRGKKLIAELKKHNINQAAFFATSSHLDKEGIERLMAYANAGHIIANHTHTHPDINRLSLQDYLAEITQTHEILKEYPNFKPWFRFPYLREGDTLEKRDGVRNYFKENNYFNAYITLNNYDWYIENLFQDAIKKGEQVDFDKLHEMDITAMYVGDLADAFRAKGWQVVSPIEAYQDPIANYQTARVMKYNPGRIGEIAKDKGQKKTYGTTLLKKTI